MVLFLRKKRICNFDQTKYRQMKTIRFVSILFISVFSFQFANAQTNIKSETIKVNGNCTMCKKHIEKSALAAGAIQANWDKKTKFLVINYDSSVTNSARIQTAIAASGYDTQDFKATDEAYKKLEECCQYDRTAMKEDKEKKE